MFRYRSRILVLPAFLAVLVLGASIPASVAADPCRLRCDSCECGLRSNVCECTKCTITCRT